MPFKKTRISEFLEYAELLLKNARKDPQINSLLANFNVGDVRYEQGLSLCKQAYDSEKLQVKLHGEQYRARSIFEKLYDEAHPNYMDHVKFMRMGHRDDLRKLDTLDAASVRDRTITGWLKQSKTFYTNILDDGEVLSRMSVYGITQEELQDVELKIAGVAEANREHKLKKGAAQDALEKRNEALDKLDKFMSEFIVICRIALKDQPQLLEMLGIVVYSKGYVSAKSKATAEKKKLKQQEAQGTPMDPMIQAVPAMVEPGLKKSKK